MTSFLNAKKKSSGGFLQPFGRFSLVLFLQAGLIVATCFWIFWPAVRGGWIWDDDAYVTQNPLLRDPLRLWKAWFEPGSFVEYYPIEQSIRWLQWKLFQENTFGYHLTNIFLHAVNSLLVWRLFHKLELRLAWVGGLLFALHPLQVETVAWIAELKNTLSMLPLLLALAAWVDYQDRFRRRDYVLALVFFLAAMLCKVSMAPLPVFFLAYAWWKRGRIVGSDVVPLLPFFLISLVLGSASIWLGQHFAERLFFQPQEVPLSSGIERISCAGQALLFYFAKVLFPLPPLPIYPQWPVDGRSLTQFFPWLVMGFAFLWFWLKRATWGKHALLGSIFFLLFLLPFVGFISVSYMKFTWVMDHFVYISILGPIGLLLAVLQHGSRLLPRLVRTGVTVLLVAYFIFFALISHFYAAKFTGLDPLFTYAIKYVPNSWIALQNVGAARGQEGRVEESILLFKKASLLSPRETLVRFNLASAYENLSRFKEAEGEYREILKIWPKALPARVELGNLLMDQERYPEAIVHLQESILLCPGTGQLHLNLGNALFQSGRFPEAAAQYQIAAGINPSWALAHYNYGRTLAQTGDFLQAIPAYQKAIRVEPQYVDAHTNLGVAFYKTGNISEALRQYETALLLDPENEAAKANLSALRGR